MSNMSAAEIRTPLDPEAQEAVQAREVRPKCCTTCRMLLALTLLVLAAVAAGVYFFFVHQKLQLNCSIDECQDIFLPNDAKSCADARCNRCSGNLKASVDSQGGFCGLVCSVEHCSSNVVAGRGASNCSQWRQPCPRCEEGWEFQLDPNTLEPTGNCSFTCTAAQRQAGCAPRQCRPEGCDACVPGFTSSNGNGCSKASSATSMSFYMYRAQSDVSYPPENCDLASAAGVMWYLHNEVVKLCPRHYNISRIIRYNVTIFNPPSVYATRQGQFGHFVQFDYGQCTVPDCPNWWEQYGYAVGCQKQDVARWKYEDSFWYSLPGRCPSQKWSNKSSDCVEQELGGNCSQPNGTQTCTWHAENAGEVAVNDLSGITDLAAFCAAGNVEYDEKTDKGRGCSFWDDKFNASRNKERVLALERHFVKRYGATAMPEPLCDGF